MVGLAGTGLGALLGLLTTVVESRLVHRAGLDTGLLHVGFPAWILLIDLGAGLGSALAGVLVAARRAGRVRPLDALRETGEQRRVMTVGRWIWALLLGVPAVVGAMLAQASGDVLVAIMVGLLVIVAGSIALQQLSPLVVPLVARLLALPARRHVVGELAQAGMRDGVRRSATTAGPVIVLFGLVVGLLGILATQTEATRVERVQQSSAQLVVVSDGDVSRRIGVDAGSRRRVARDRRQPAGAGPDVARWLGPGRGTGGDRGRPRGVPPAHPPAAARRRDGALRWPAAPSSARPPPRTGSAGPRRCGSVASSCRWSPGWTRRSPVVPTSSSTGVTCRLRRSSTPPPRRSSDWRPASLRPQYAIALPVWAPSRRCRSGRAASPTSRPGRTTA